MDGHDDDDGDDIANSEIVFIHHRAKEISHILCDAFSFKNPHKISISQLRKLKHRDGTQG